MHACMPACSPPLSTLLLCVLADVIDSWVADKKQHGNAHKTVLDKLVALNLYLRDKECVHI